MADFFDKNSQTISNQLLAKASNWVDYGNPEWRASYGKNDAYYIQSAKIYHQSTGIPLVNQDK